MSIFVNGAIFYLTMEQTDRVRDSGSGMCLERDDARQGSYSGRCNCVLLIPSYNPQRVHWRWWGHGWGDPGCIQHPHSWALLWKQFGPPAPVSCLSMAVQYSGAWSLSPHFTASTSPQGGRGLVCWGLRHQGELQRPQKSVSTGWFKSAICYAFNCEVKKVHQLYLLDKETFLMSLTKSTLAGLFTGKNTQTSSYYETSK